jgi:C4-dicarboxylate transporter DctM subunit
MLAVLALLVLVTALILLGMDVAFSLGFACLVYLVLTMWSPLPIPLAVIPQQLVAGLDSFPLLAIPLFILAGELMNQGGVTVRLARFAAALVGWMTGGLAQVVVLVNVIMAGMSGSAVADAAATGSVLIPAMRARRYPTDMAGAVTAAASTIGPIIPPSIPFVIFGSVASVSVGRLFMGGVIPGLLMGLALMLTVYWEARRRHVPREARQSIPELAVATRDAALALLLPVIIIGGILLGVATPTEAAAVAVLWALFLAVVVYREIPPRRILAVLGQAAITSGAILITVGAASLLGWIAAAEGFGPKLAGWFSGTTHSPFITLLFVNVVLLILGTVLEPVPLLLVIAPILLPVMKRVGVDPVHFGVVFVVNIQIALLSPPVGLCLFTIASIAGIPVMTLARALVPYIIALVAVLILISYFPALVLWLPGLVFEGR